MSKQKKMKIDNDTWIRKHFKTIVDKYGGKFPYIFVVQGKIFPVKPGDNIAKIEEKITRRYGKPIGMPVPQSQDFSSILIFIG